MFKEKRIGLFVSDYDWWMPDVIKTVCRELSQGVPCPGGVRGVPPKTDIGNKIDIRNSRKTIPTPHG